MHDEWRAKLRDSVTAIVTATHRAVVADADADDG